MQINLKDRIAEVERNNDIQKIVVQDNITNLKEKRDIALEGNSNGSNEEKDQNESELSKEDKSKMILEKLKQETKELSNTHTELKFGIHEATNQVTIKVIDSDTSKVIREIPSEKILDIMGKIIELSGLFVDEKR